MGLPDWLTGGRRDPGGGGMGLPDSPMGGRAGVGRRAGSPVGGREGAEGADGAVAALWGATGALAAGASAIGSLWGRTWGSGALGVTVVVGAPPERTSRRGV